MASPGITPELIREHLKQVLADRRFVRSERLSRFLTYTVEKTLAGEGETLKEYLIAIEVYGKPATYDPSVDSLVRVEASRLRTKLLDYYNGEGRSGPIKLEFPKGSYAPVFDLQDPPLSSVATRSPDADIVVEPSLESHRNRTAFRFAIGLGLAVIAGLTGVLLQKAKSIEPGRLEAFSRGAPFC